MNISVAEHEPLSHNSQQGIHSEKLSKQSNDLNSIQKRSDVISKFPGDQVMPPISKIEQNKSNSSKNHSHSDEKKLIG